MILGTHETLVAEWQGALPKLGSLFAIRDGETILHRGSFGYIRTKWLKLTGQTLKS